MLPNFQQYCFPLYSAPRIPSSQTQDPGGDALPLGTEVLGGTQESVGTLAGRLSCIRAAGFKVRHLDPCSRHKQSPDKDSSKAAGQRLDRGTWPHDWPHPPSITVPQPGSPPFYIRVWQRELWGSPSLPPPSHTHSPFFLKSPRSAGRWRPRNTTMTAGATQTSLPRPLQNARRQPSTERCGLPACAPSCRAPTQAEGRGCSPGPPPTFPLAPPLH